MPAPLTLADRTAHELADLHRRGEVSPVETVEACVARIEQVDPQINSVITLCAEEALEDARRLADRIARGADPGPLAGVPFGLKDVIDTAAVRTTGGSRLYADHVPPRDAPLVARLRAAGALLLAKLNTMEFNYGDEWNTHYGPVRNPWDTERFAGGSSSGPGGAVGAHLLPFGIGEDTGGSVRLPCSNSGLAGIKPTYGRIPRTGMMQVSWSMDQPGPMARSVTDVALVLRTVAGQDAGDPSSSSRPVPDYLDGLDRGVEGLRIGVPRTWFFDDIDPEVETIVRAAIGTLEEAGARTVPVDLSLFEMTTTVAWVVIGAEFTSLHEITRSRIEEYGKAMSTRLVQGEFWSAQDYLRAQRVRHLMQRQCEAAFEEVDVIAAPAAPSFAGRFHGEEPMVRIGDELRPWIEESPRPTQPFSLTGMPAAVVRCGFGEEGLPVGLQIAAPPHSDALALRVLRAFERRSEVGERRPPVLG